MRNEAGHGLQEASSDPECKGLHAPEYIERRKEQSQKTAAETHRAAERGKALGDILKVNLDVVGGYNENRELVGRIDRGERQMSDVNFKMCIETEQNSKMLCKEINENCIWNNQFYSHWCQKRKKKIV